MKTNWKELFEETFPLTKDKLSDLVMTLNMKELEERFDSGYGGAEGRPFTAWSKDWVYFPVCYDGSEWIGFVPRNPCEIATEHKGG